MSEAFLTYFDQRYVARAVVMLRSLRLHAPEGRIFTLCFDDVAASVIRALDMPGVTVIDHEDILAFEPRLRACADRPRAAFYATHKPALPLYVLTRWPELSRVTHIDTDTHFHSPPATVFAENPEAAVMLSPHRYHPDNAHWAQYYGAFNAGFISWRNCATARQCLADYMEDCLDRVEPDETDGRFMNQGYLTTWPQRYDGVHVIAHPGANLAPWNLRAHTLSIARTSDGPQVRVSGAPLVFYHFSRMFRDDGGRWRTDFVTFGENNLAIALVHIYQPYFREVDHELAQLHAQGIEPLRMELPANIDDFYFIT